MNRIVAVRVCFEYQFAFLKSPTAKASPARCPELFMPGKSPTKCSAHYDDHLQSFFFLFFLLPFPQYKAFLNPRLDCGRIISRRKFFFEHPQHAVPDSVLLIMFLLYSRLISLCSRFHMSSAQGGALKEQEHFSTFGIFYFRSAAESQGFSGEGMCKHFLE